MIIISLGANVTSRWGNAATTILEAFRQLEREGISVLRHSALYATTPMGMVNQPVFVNAAAVAFAALSPLALLTVLKEIEAKAGRKRSRRWGPRPLDLDIVDYKSRILNWPNNGVFARENKHHLVLPHPQIQFRPFVLRPVADIAPFWHHPVFGHTAAHYLAGLRRANAGKILEVVHDGAQS